MHLSNFAIEGDVRERIDTDQVNKPVPGEGRFVGINSVSSNPANGHNAAPISRKLHEVYLAKSSIRKQGAKLYDSKAALPLIRKVDYHGRT